MRLDGSSSWSPVIYWKEKDHMTQFFFSSVDHKSEIMRLFCSFLFFKSPFIKVLQHLISLSTFAVWGGDPVYPTVNYIQDPNEVIDYRGPDFHEPTPNMLAYLKEVVSLFHIFFLNKYSSLRFIVWQ